MRIASLSFWARGVAVGAAAGFAIGVVFGTLSTRAIMRAAFLLAQETEGFTTAAGARVGRFTRDGTVELAQAAGILGLLLGVAYVVGRVFLPPGLRYRTIVYTVVTTLFGVAATVGGNLDDFAFLPVTENVLMFAAAFALAALPLPWLVERFAPDRPHGVPRGSRLIVAAAVVLFGAALVAALVAAYREPSVYGCCVL